MDQLEEFYNSLTHEELEHMLDRNKETFDRISNITNAIVAKKDNHDPLRRMKQFRNYMVEAVLENMLIREALGRL